jgi:hypothetical protein
MASNLRFVPLLTWLCILCLANAKNHFAGPVWGHGCILDNVEIKISSKEYHHQTLYPLIKSLKQLLPCFIPVLLIVPDNQESFFLNLLDRPEFRNILNKKIYC